MKSCSLVLLAALAISSIQAAEPLLRDEFSGPGPESRRAMRGDWKFEDGIASVTQDDELYQKYKDHGPIIFYDLDYTDASVSFAFRAEGSKTVVFTMNGEAGHVFRFVLSERGLNIRAFPPDAEAKSIALENVAEVPLVAGKWTKVKVELRGGTATVSIGEDYEGSWSHPSLARPKNNLSIGFSFGTLQVKDWVVEG